MIDIHSHILPGVDDGAQTMEDSIRMAELAVDEGITTIVATPHHNNGQFENYKNNILIQVSELNRRLKERDIPLEVLPGQETRLYDGMLEGLQNDEILTINKTSSYVFVEFPHDQVPHYTSTLLFNLQLEGYQPIIVHPERNVRIQENPNILYSFIKNGAFSQITAASIAGNFGNDIKRLSHQFIDSNLTHLIASDVHSTKRQSYQMKKADNEIRKAYGNPVMEYFSENAVYVIEGSNITADQPLRVKKKKVFGLF
ncbi:tyrosine-protein phosphatase [Halobacillus seohaensis]|uniref:Tyrosine-protein phosphatase n=1 Tax=Halobacillus seohaensis TaxID=447421 RepID=A0ABW2EJ25_9BACI